MESMSVRPEQVTVLAGEIDRGANGIQNELDQLDSQVKTLIGQWDGAAQQSYHVAQTEWNKSLTAIRELLTQFAGKTREISSQYVDSDNRSARHFDF